MRLVLVDHSFHQRTRSTVFFLEMMRRHFEVVNLWDERWDGLPGVCAQQILAHKPDAVALMQAMLPFDELAHLGVPITWIPMYDDTELGDREFWLRFKAGGIKVLCFAKAIFDHATALGIQAHRVQFFPESIIANLDYSAPRVFFWHRGSIGFEQVKKVLGDQPIQRLVLKDDPDPNFAPIEVAPEDASRFNLERIQGFLEPDEYLRLVESCNVYIAPRRKEGIGMSFLEAMARGMVVVAPDAPTMNEYIEHGKTGYLYDPENPGPIAFGDLERIGRAAAEHVRAGHSAWLAQEQGIVDFVRSSAPSFSRPSGLSLAPLRLRRVLGRIKRSLVRS